MGVSVHCQTLPTTSKNGPWAKASTGQDEARGRDAGWRRPEWRALRHAGEVGRRTPLVLGRQAHRLAGACRLPTAEGTASWQLTSTGQSQGIGTSSSIRRRRQPSAPCAPRRSDGGLGVRRARQRLPLPTRPRRRSRRPRRIPGTPHWRPVAAGLEGRHGASWRPYSLSQPYQGSSRSLPRRTVAGGNGDQRVAGAAPRRGRAPRPDGAHVFESVLADQHRRGFQMDALVLDAHDDDPPGMLPADRPGQRQVVSINPVDHRAHRGWR
jgi:hypothetical protein